MATIDPDFVATLTDEDIAESRAQLRAADDVFEYEQYRRMSIREMTPDQMARACDIARDRIKTAPDAETRAILVAFIRDVELEGSRRFPGRKVAGRLDVGVAGVIEALGRAT